MINTLAELLKELSEKENQRLKELDITHPPTIGAMYEGLTADIMQKALFAGLNLVVAKSSFIKGSKTGFTTKAGRCIASISSINGVDYLFVTLNNYNKILFGCTARGLYA